MMTKDRSWTRSYSDKRQVVDQVQWDEHFDSPDSKAKELMRELIKRQPGYLVPKLVREIGGQPGKTPLDLQLHP